MNTRESIDKAIEELRGLIERAVRDEQLRHQLTGLPNASALDEHMQRAIDGSEAFWLAFIEIDRFKTINDQFGYQRADALLCEVARTLEQAAPRFFADQANAFHAHGDEFYVLGRARPTRFSRDEIDRKLDAMRDSIANIALPAGDGAGLMKCTVSVGWSENTAETARGLMHDIELAVSHAKRHGRNRVVMFDESMRKAPIISLRSGCAECEASFSFDVPAGTPHDGDIFCPNCGGRSSRPAHPMRAAAPQDITDLPPVQRST